MTGITRQTFIQSTGAMAAAAITTSRAGGQEAPATTAPSDNSGTLDLKFAVKYGMVQIDAPMSEKLALLKQLGFDGVELSSPNSFDRDEVLRARDAAGLPIHGVVDSVHWQQRLSDPDPAVRETGRRALLTAIEDVKAYGGSSVLLVPGRVADPERENAEHVWTRSIEQIRAVLPRAAELGIHILVENVWNGFCYEHDGPDDQSADRLAEYLDAINSPWVGSYFDLGNHRKYGVVEEWIRTLGRRIVKLDVKDWGVTAGWAKIGEGDVDWTEVRRALADIGFTGWCTAEVGGGGPERLQDIKRRMDEVLRGVAPRPGDADDGGETR